MIKYGNLNLQTANIITERVQHSQMADRIINSYPVSRRSGNKFINDEFGTKTISIKGIIISPSASGLQGIKDEMQKELSRPEQQLTINTGGVYYAP